MGGRAARMVMGETSQWLQTVTEREIPIETNFVGFYTELSNTLHSSASLLRDTQAKCRLALTQAARTQSPGCSPESPMQAPSRESSFGPTLDELLIAPLDRPAGSPAMCFPESPVSYPGRSRPRPFRGESEESLTQLEANEIARLSSAS